MGPVAQYHENSKYYSAIRPKPDRDVDAALPHITIELPVFKESLTETMYVLLCTPRVLIHHPLFQCAICELSQEGYANLRSSGRHIVYFHP